MRLAISNIAWDSSEDKTIVELLHQYKIDAIDVAPGKYFPEPAKATEQQILRVKTWWMDCGIEITGMQALLFGTHGLNIFSASNIQEVMLQHLAHICRIAAGLGATRLVFGSPKNRDRNGFDDGQVMEIAVGFFRRLGDIAHANNVVICLEPNPACYGANFMLNSAETAQVVKAVDHSAIRMQLDTGAVTINSEIIADVVCNNVNLIGHIHASEPELVPLGDGSTDHKKIAVSLQKYLAQHIVSIEMLATKNEPSVISIERALKTAVSAYRTLN